MDSPNRTKWVFSVMTLLVITSAFPPLHMHNCLLCLIPFSSLCSKLPSHSSPTTYVVSDCTMWTGCALTALQNERQKDRLLSFDSYLLLSLQSLQEVITYFHLHDLWLKSSFCKQLVMLWIPLGVCGEQGPGAFSERSHAPFVEGWNVLGVRRRRKPF